MSCLQTISSPSLSHTANCKSTTIIFFNWGLLRLSWPLRPAQSLKPELRNSTWTQVHSYGNDRTWRAKAQWGRCIPDAQLAKVVATPAPYATASWHNAGMPIPSSYCNDRNACGIGSNSKSFIFRIPPYPSNAPPIFSVFPFPISHTLSSMARVCSVCCLVCVCAPSSPCFPLPLAFLTLSEFLPFMKLHILVTCSACRIPLSTQKLPILPVLMTRELANCFICRFLSTWISWKLWPLLGIRKPNLFSFLVVFT